MLIRLSNPDSDDNEYLIVRARVFENWRSEPTGSTMNRGGNR